MNKLQKLIIILGFLLPVPLHAIVYEWLTFKMTDNSEVSVAADNLSINYNSGVLHLKSTTVDENFNIGDVRMMRFTSSPANLNDVSESRQEAVDYYSLEGIKVGRFVSIEEARQELPSGTYVSKSATRTIKVIF